MSSPTLQSAQKVLREKVSRDEVARYYLKSELPNIVKTSGDDINKSIDLLDDKQLWRLLEALSYTYRMNGMFHLLTNDAYSWAEVELPMSAIALSGMTPATNKVVYSDQVNRDVTKFVAYLKQYFKEHPHSDDDPEGLGELRPTGGSIENSTLITIESRGKITIVDGSHRLLEMAQAGKQSVTVYAGLRGSKASKHMAGDSTFLTLRRLYDRYSTPEQREEILDVAAMLARSSTDGRRAVREYWIEHARNKKHKDAGKSIIERIDNPSKKSDETRS